MSRLSITNIDFLESASTPDLNVVGGSIVPGVSTAVATDLDTVATVGLDIGGDLLSGFQLTRLTRGSAASAASAAASIGGGAFVFADADAG